MPPQDETPSERDDRSWRVLFVVVLVVVASLTALAFAVGTESPSDARYVEAIRDDFDRADGVSLAATGWQVSRGNWVVRGGAAVVTPEAGGRQVALRGAVSFGSVQARISGRARCGLVIRYFEPGTYVFLERIPDYAVWNLVSVRKGTETVLARVSDGSESLVDVRVETGARVITAVVGQRSVTVTEPAGRSSGFVGLFAREGDTSQCTWDSFVAGNGR